MLPGDTDRPVPDVYHYQPHQHRQTWRPTRRIAPLQDEVWPARGWEGSTICPLWKGRAVGRVPYPRWNRSRVPLISPTSRGRVFCSPLAHEQRKQQMKRTRILMRRGAIRNIEMMENFGARVLVDHSIRGKMGSGVPPVRTTLDKAMYYPLPQLLTSTILVSYLSISFYAASHLLNQDETNP